MLTSSSSPTVEKVEFYKDVYKMRRISPTGQNDGLYVVVFAQHPDEEFGEIV